MGMRFKMAVLLGLAAVAAYSAAEAYASVRPAWETALPQELYAQLLERSEEAAFTLRQRDGYVAVYAGGRERVPELVTSIEVEGLRASDRALLEKGIPAADRREMLTLLEDLGS